MISVARNGSDSKQQPTEYTAHVGGEGTKTREGNSFTLDNTIIQAHLTPGLMHFAQYQATYIDRYTKIPEKYQRILALKIFFRAHVIKRHSWF